MIGLQPFAHVGALNEHRGWNRGTREPGTWNTSPISNTLEILIGLHSMLTMSGKSNSPSSWGRPGGDTKRAIAFLATSNLQSSDLRGHSFWVLQGLSWCPRKKVILFNTSLKILEWAPRFYRYCLLRRFIQPPNWFGAGDPVIFRPFFLHPPPITQ